MARSPLLTEAQVAELLDLAPYTLKRLRSDGKPLLPYLRLHDGPRSPIRYRQQDVDRFIDSRLVA
jgi:hypothetical protein